MNLTFSSLLEEYTKRKDFYDSIISQVKQTIQGRICHTRVVVLTILRHLLPIKTYLEIGVHNGTSMSFVLHHPESLQHCIGVDLFEQTISRYTRDKLSLDRTYSNIQKNNISASPITLIKGNSLEFETLVKVKEVLEDKEIDLLFIDGLHTYEGIQNDFEKYSLLVKEGGYIVLDDYEPKYPDILAYVETLKQNPLFRIVGVFENNELIVQKKIT